MSKEKDEIKKFLDNLPDDMEIMEAVADIETQIDYIHFAHSFDHGKPDIAEINRLGEMLMLPQIDMMEKKRNLAILAHQDKVEALRHIERFFNIAPEEIKGYTALALQECKMFVVGSLTGQSGGFIAGGLGGKKGKMRFYIMVLPKKGDLFTDAQLDLLKKEFEFSAKESGSEIEKFDFCQRYAAITVFISKIFEPYDFVDEVLDRCDEIDDFIHQYYFMTNSKIPKGKEIDQIIEDQYADED
jgi:hypothetical protein